MARRHPRLAALAAAIAAAVIALILAVVLSGGDDKPNARTTTQPAQPQDPHAADRAAIQRTMIAYQRSLRPEGDDDPCRYLTAYARRGLEANATLSAPTDAPCGVKARAADADKNLGLHLATATSLGVANIEFGPFPELERKGIDAEVHWRAPGHPRALLVDRNARWLIEAIGP